MPAPINAVGHTYGRLVVLEKAETRASAAGNTRTMWRCRCECGKVVDVTIAKLRNGHTQSCGCLFLEIISKPQKHGLRMKRERTKEYNTWAGMRSRCNTPSDDKYPLYGGRGITICERWDHYDLFLADMGKAPSRSHSIDRIDTNGNYEPANCRWATASQQANNLRTTRRYTADGVTDTVTGWSEKWGITRATIENRLRRGQSFEHIASVFGRRG
jgi:hypothetical protein